MLKNRYKDDTEQVNRTAVNSSDALDDEQRVRVLSPSMLIAKRFFRNRLAIVGLIIIVAMFAFSFLGVFLQPYSESQQFYKKEIQPSTYASATQNENYYYTVVDDMPFNSLNLSDFILAKGKGSPTFETKLNNEPTIMAIQMITDDNFNVLKCTPVGTADESGAGITPNSGKYISNAARSAISAAIAAGEKAVAADGKDYFIIEDRRSYSLYTGENYAFLSKNVYAMYNKDDVIDYTFKLTLESAIRDGQSEFAVDGKTYSVEADEEDNSIVYMMSDDGTKSEFASISNFIVTPNSPEIFLSIDFRYMLSQAIENGNESFDFAGEGGESVHYTIERKDREYVIKTETVTDLMDMYASPSKAHPVGTDGSGMDILVRLMYGGRVSLIIGFIVVIIEALIGVIIGGIAGYFGRWVDQLLMRIVDIINCIPQIPLYIILGTVMSTLKVDPQVRIYLLVVMLGVTGWTSIARVTRGQILSLREQEFMTATEATGLSVTRRIFRHLVPNVIPQLIVYTTMGLGSVILTEATLSFLGLGVKYPFASWGNIINAVNDSYVLQNYLFVWIPAGLLILLTVLGFNFIGDGLRDAFDPKMKR